jgi:outer membrane lipoprotein-sorting protein
MKKLLHYTALTILLLFVTTTGKTHAQTVNAKSVLEKTSQLYKQWSGMDIRFTTHIRSEKNGVSESFEGNMIMKADKFRLETPDMMTWFDGTTQWTYMLRTGEVNVSIPTGSDLQFLNPMILLQGYQKDFNVSYIGESTSANAKTAYDIMLTPKKKEDIEKIEIQIEKNISLPAKLVVTMRNDMRNTIHIKEIKEANHPDETFIFPENEYPDADIIDLR